MSKKIVLSFLIVLLAAGLIAQKAVDKGLTVAPTVKTSFAPDPSGSLIETLIVMGSDHGLSIQSPLTSFMARTRIM